VESQEENKTHHVPKWLKLIQENSWELELLISGGAIFTLFQVSDIWVQWLQSASFISFLPGRNMILLIGALGIEILKIGFISHLLLRAFWLSMVCINYAFPGGINKDKIKWKKPFKISVKENEDLQSPIVKVDRYCGLVIYLSVISTFLLAGIVFGIFCLVTLPTILFGELSGIYGIAVGSIFIFYVLDLLLGGLFRKIPYLSYLSFPFFSFFDILTFRVLYQKSAFLFFSNVPKIKFVISACLFFSFAITLSYLNTYRIMKWPNAFDSRQYKWQMSDGVFISPNSYRNTQRDGYHHYMSIQSKIVHDNYLDLFIPYDVHADEILDLSKKKKENRKLTQVFSISIDDSLYTDLSWNNQWSNSVNDIGISCFVPIGHLADGAHTLRIHLNSYFIPIVEKIYNNRTIEEFIEGWPIVFVKDTKVDINR